MTKVNPVFIDYLLNPLVGGADSDEETLKYRNVDPNDEIAIKMIIKSVLKPEFEQQPNAFKEASKKALSYYLTTDKINFGRVFNSNLLAFDHPTNPKDFFYWIWEIFFGEEDYIIKDIEDYIEYNDIYEPLRLATNNPNLKL